jgi:hypothetical protein
MSGKDWGHENCQIGNIENILEILEIFKVFEFLNSRIVHISSFSFSWENQSCPFQFANKPVIAA